jgi:hypothetical protein
VSIEHKAWPFDCDGFEQEFGPILLAALESGDVAGIRSFINAHHSAMWDAWDAETLSTDWEEQVIARSRRFGHKQFDAEWYGDIALTKYYRPYEEMGLMYGWDVLLAYLETVPRIAPVAEDFIRGFPFGPEDRPFDPGKQGTGFMRARFVRSYHQLLQTTEFPPPPLPGDGLYAGRYAEEESVPETLERLKALYSAAVEMDRGLMFADFQ